MHRQIGGLTLLLLGLLWATLSSGQSVRGNQKFDRIEQAVQISEHVFADRPLTLFCGCTQLQGRMGHERCGYSPLERNFRSSKAEMRPLIPLSRFGLDFPEWQGAPGCVDRNGKRYSGAQCALKKSPEFSRIAADLYNWFPIEGELEYLRTGARLGEVPGEPRRFGSCDVELEAQVIEPRTEMRGDIARTFLYFDLSYPRHSFMDEEQRRIMEAWNVEDPVDPWECERAARIARAQGNPNPFVESACSQARLEGRVPTLPIQASSAPGESDPRREVCVNCVIPQSTLSSGATPGQRFQEPSDLSPSQPLELLITLEPERMELQEGQASQFEVNVGTQLLEPLVLGVSSSSERVQLSPPTLRFTPENWEQAQTVQVQTLDDSSFTGDESHWIDLKIVDSGGLDHGLMSLPRGRLTLREDERKGRLLITVAEENQQGTLGINSLSFPMEGKTRATFEVTPGTYQVVLQDYGQTTDPQSVEVVNGLTSRLNFGLTPLLPPPDVVPATALEGPVRDESETEPISEAKEFSEVEESGDSGWIGHTVTLSITGLALYQAYGAYTDYQDLQKENDQLAAEYSASQDPAVRTKYESNEDEMKSLGTQYYAWGLVSLLGIGFESYLLLSDSEEDSVSSISRFHPVVRGPQHWELQWRWRF